MNKVYAISDLHGQYELWVQVKQYLDPTDTLICLGDCIDRGPSGFNILVEMLNRDNTVLLKGNHEDLMLQDYYNIKNHEMQIDPYSSLWFLNGGYDTYQNIISCYGAKYIDDIFKKIKYLPISYVDSCNGNLTILNHSGFTPGYIYDEMWDRQHFRDSWPDGFDNVYIIHGHTPVQNLSYKGVSEAKDIGDITTIIKYCGGHKIDIDLGCFFSHKICLLDLDTFEPIYFYGKECYEPRN